MTRPTRPRALLLATLATFPLVGCGRPSEPTVTEIELQQRLANAEFRAVQAEARLVRAEKQLTAHTKCPQPAEEEPVDTAGADIEPEPLDESPAAEAEAEPQPARPFAPEVEQARLRS